mmetsp:Transcript_15970/g.22752  ORF Transcript_15970/g.22752 Transcript_15970/m.22752 type:complete len:308 (-) Transcript_15970:194-1117(-)|eukprot:CAMPEP_0184863148 /NCGR_PEP_ID=MMETSP0580-20130426/9365_1 /TAXON_ID=1118495 /ORGANISM="Dactyliosolen fragilissimus" /LENGTH=307 /DNA_ID=CAMNT_0027361283 /DNA_START=142 /DNA_END=1065 /DNA_ORIENTATION=-
MSTDIFECFGSDQEDSDENIEDDVPTSKSLTSSKKGKREDSCGVMTFHKNIEYSLLLHVKNHLSTNEEGSLHGEVISTETVLKAIDTFCYNRHWMMHVGPEKAKILSNSLQDRIDRVNKNNNFLCVELGTYCGYSSIVMGDAMRRNFSNHSDITFSLITVEAVPEFVQISRDMIEMSQLSDIITVLQSELMIDGTTSDISMLIQKEIKNKFPEFQAIDFLFIDHDKDMYLSDLKKLENSGMISSNTTVVADNVIFAQINDYIHYMLKHQKSGLVETETKEVSVEYTDNGKDDIPSDGMEITTYLKTP